MTQHNTFTNTAGDEAVTQGGPDEQNNVSVAPPGSILFTPAAAAAPKQRTNQEILDAHKKEVRQQIQASRCRK